MFGISIYQLLIILAIVILVFGTKKIKELGEDVGAGIGSFKKSLKATKEAVDEVKK